MKTKKIYIFFISSILSILLLNCKKENNTPPNSIPEPQEFIDTRTLLNKGDSIKIFNTDIVIYKLIANGFTFLDTIPITRNKDTLIVSDTTYLENKILFCKGDTLIKDKNKISFKGERIDYKKEYKSRLIGDKYWMLENMKFNYLPKESRLENDTIYGYFYTWEVAQNVCPEGWHLPSNDEWNDIIEFLGGKEIAGGKMKKDTLWQSPNTGVSANSYFDALPGGYHHFKVSIGFTGQNRHGYWWSNTEDPSSFAFAFFMHFDHSEIFNSDFDKRHAFSVRCIKD
jgi:uncharacterized protein (TIGR02145 family)